MQITVIYGQNHKGSSYHIARLLAEKIGGEITEFFLPKDFGEFCLGCTQCFTVGEERCPHYEKLRPITEAMDEADVIILASPVYVYHASGSMKALLDHYGYRWMAHRPEGKMFSKQGVSIATAAGAGWGSTLKDMNDSLFYWGVGRTYRFGLAVSATSYDGINKRKKRVIERSTDKIAKAILRRHGKVKPGLRCKAFFFLMHLLQKDGWNKKDVDYWKREGWTGKARPWKKG